MSLSRSTAADLEEEIVEHHPLHLHSMLVHGAIAFAPLAAGAYVLEAASMSLFGIDPGVWAFLLRLSLLAILALSLPSIATGISERNRMFVNWPPSHRAKLALSIILVVLVSCEIAALVVFKVAPTVGSWLGLAVIVGNCSVVFLLSYYGLRITLGRQAFVQTSYQPDMDFDPPMNILDCVADFASDAPKLIDVREERAS